MGLASFGSVGSSGMSPQTAVQYGFSPPEPKGNDSFYAALGFEPFLRQSPPAADVSQKGLESSGQRMKQGQQAQQAQRQQQKQTQSQNQRQKGKRKEGNPAGNDQQKVSPIKHADAVSPFGLFAGSGSSCRSPPMIGMNLAQSLDQKTAYLDGMFERMVDDWDLVPEGNPVI